MEQTIRVIDGPIKGALVRLDANNNGVCELGETQGTTAADGSVTLSMPAADAGKYPVLALVDTDAVDADNGPVTIAFSLRAPPRPPRCGVRPPRGRRNTWGGPAFVSHERQPTSPPWSAR